MSLFSTSATLRPSHCLLLGPASGPMLLTGIPHLMSVARQSRHFGRAPASSGLPRIADSRMVGRHVSKVPRTSHPIIGIRAAELDQFLKFDDRASDPQS